MTRLGPCALLLAAAGCAQGADDPDARTYDAAVIDAREFIDAVIPDARPDAEVALPPDAAPGLDASGATCATETTPITNNTAVPIGDLTTVTSEIVANGLDPFLARLTITTNITHTHAADLIILLISPTGERVRLTDNQGSGTDDAFAGTLWTDAADENAADHSFLVAPAPQLVPQTPLGALFGSDPNGTWTLSIQDDAGSDTGSLVSWTLEFTTYPQAPVEEVLTATATDVLPINDNATVTDTLTLGDVNVPLCKVEVTTLIDHSYGSDLIITVIDPAGHRIKLSEAFGEGYDDTFLGTVWRDDADEPVGEYTFSADGVVTPLTPYYGLSAEWGNQAVGTWTLEVVDDATTDTGQLMGWTLRAIACSCD